MLREIKWVGEGENKVAEWASLSNPTENDAYKFLRLQESLKKNNKQTYNLNDLSDDILNSWKGKNINVFIIVHSCSIEDKKDYELATETLLKPTERDQKVAKKTEDINVLEQKLQETHADLDGDSIAWKSWANFILTETDNLEKKKETLIKASPPTHLKLHFSEKRCFLLLKKKKM